MGILPKSSRNVSISYQSSSNLSSDSSTNSSLSSQTSLPSIPSLTPAILIIQNLATLTGHSSYIFSLALGVGADTTNNHHFYSGGSSGEIRRWNTDSTTKGKHIADNNTVIIAKCDSAVKSISILDDKLLTAHHDHRIRVWKIQENDNNTHQNQKKYKCIATLPTQKDSCMSLFSAKNYVEIRRHKKSTWVHHVDAVSALILTKDDGSGGGAPLLYSVSWDRTFKVWRTSDFKCIESVQNAHDDAINAIALCTNNDGFVYTGSADKTIKVWRKQSNKKMKHSVVAILKKHKSAVNGLAISKDGCLLYSGACDKSIIVWEKDGTEGNMVVVGGLRGHKKAILCLSVVEDLVCSGSADKTVRIWRKEKGFGNSHSCLGVLEGHDGPVKCLVAAPAPAAQSEDDDDDDDDDDSTNGEKTANNYVVYSGSLDCNIKVWKILIS